MALLKVRWLLLTITFLILLAFGLYNMILPVIAGNLIPNFPFPFQPDRLGWFGHEVIIDWFRGPFERVYYEPSWLFWSLSLYVGAAGLIFLGLRLAFRRR